MKFDFKLIPAIRLLFVAIIGVLLGLLINIHYIILLSIIILSSVLLITKKLQVVSYYLIVLCLGIWFTYHLNQISISTPEKIYQEFPALVSGKIVKTIKITNTHAKLIVEGNFDAQPLPLLENQRVLVTIYGLNWKPLKFETGMKFFADVKARTPKKPQLPTDFPENNYASSLDVKWVASTSSRNTSITKPPNGFLYFKDKQVINIQNRINKLFNKSAAPIITALLTGDKTKIPFETKQLFSYSGTAHVLAVSGLHVGIIATILFFLLGFVSNNWLKFILFSILITAFVIFSGLQPSAMRAGIMAVLFVYARTIQRHANPLNIVAAAILLILILFPEMIYSVGFQMSVSAIIGIIILFQPILKFFKNIIKSENLIVNFIFSSLAITLSATIIVSPLVAYYFKVYSLVSPLANLLVIPLMTLGMCFSIIALFLSYIYLPIASIYAVSADSLINLSQSINKWAVGLPSAYLTGDNLVFPVILISLIITYLTLSKTLKQIIFRFSVSAIVVLSLMYLTPEKEKEKLNIYPREQYVAIELPLRDNQKTFIIIDRKPKQKPSKDFAMLNHMKMHKSLLKIFYSGNAGLSIVDFLKNSTNIKSHELSIDGQKEIQHILNIKEPLPQIINLR